MARPKVRAAGRRFRALAATTSAFFGWSTIDDPQGAILFMIGRFGPSLAGWWLLRRAGRTDTLRRLTDPRPISVRLWLVALLGYPLVFAPSAALVVLAGGAWPAFEGAAAWWPGPGALAGGLALVALLGPMHGGPNAGRGAILAVASAHVGTTAP